VIQHLRAQGAGQATTKLFEGVMAQIAGTGGIDFAYIGNILIIMAILYLLAGIFSFVQGWIMSGVAAKVTYTFRKDIAAKINRLPLRYFDSTTQGEVLSRVTNDVDTVSQTLNQSLSQIITSVVTVVGILIMMLTISWQMTLISLLVIPLVAYGVTLISRLQLWTQPLWLFLLVLPYGFVWWKTPTRSVTGPALSGAAATAAVSTCWRSAPPVPWRCRW